jgi:hypothetical protein
MFEMLHSPIARSRPSQFAHSFLTDGSGMDEPDRPLPLILPLYVNPLAPNQEQMRVLLISSPTWVTDTIYDLHARGFANVKDWSSLIPGANPGEVMSILTRRRQRP